MPENKSLKHKQKNADGAEKLSDPVKLLGLAVAGMNSFLSRIGQLSVFADAKTPLPEWLIMNSLARKPDLRSGSLARNLGLTVPRADAILASLKQKNWVEKDEGESRAWSLTESGRTNLANLENGLKTYLAESMGGRERSLSLLVRTLRQMARKSDDGEKAEDDLKSPD